MKQDIDERHPLIVAGASVRYLVQLAQHVPRRCIACDLFCDWDTHLLAASCRKLNSLDDLVGILNELGSSNILPGGGCENAWEILDSIPSERVIGSSPQVMAKLRTPEHWCELLKSRNIRVPRFFRSSQSPMNGSWLRKKVRSAGGTGIEFVPDAVNSVDLNSDIFFQERISGRPYSASCFSFADRTVLLAVFEQLIGLAPCAAPSPFSYCGNIGPLAISNELRQQLATIVETISSDQPVRGLWGFDFVVENDQTAVPIEINPRPTASLELLYKKFPLDWIGAQLGEWDQAAIDESAEQAARLLQCDQDFQPKGQLFGKAIVYLPPNLVCRVDEFLFDDFLGMYEQGRAADIPIPGILLKPRSPVVTLFAQGECREEVYRHLISAATLVIKSGLTAASIRMRGNGKPAVEHIGSANLAGHSGYSI